MLGETFNLGKLALELIPQEGGGISISGGFP